MYHVNERFASASDASARYLVVESIPDDSTALLIDSVGKHDRLFKSGFRGSGLLNHGHVGTFVEDSIGVFNGHSWQSLPRRLMALSWAFTDHGTAMAPPWAPMVMPWQCHVLSWEPMAFYGHSWAFTNFMGFNGSAMAPPLSWHCHRF